MLNIWSKSETSKEICRIFSLDFVYYRIRVVCWYILLFDNEIHRYLDHMDEFYLLEETNILVFWFIEKKKKKEIIYEYEKPWEQLGSLVRSHFRRQF